MLIFPQKWNNASEKIQESFFSTIQKTGGKLSYG